ncbi:MAG: ABC transporter substrate-binding protein [Ilumatobacteraceae bacterium]
MSSSQQSLRRVVAAIITSVAVLASCSSGSDGSTDTEQLRIVSLSPTATEMMYLIGAEDLLVAVDSLSNFPAEAAEKVTDLSAFEPNAEAILGYEPDVVLLGFDSNGISEQLTSADPSITVWLGAAAASLDDAYRQIMELGELTGRVDEAERAMSALSERITSAMEGVSAPPGSTYYYELDDTLYSVTSNTFIGSLLSQFGLVSIADGVEEGNDYPQLSAEVVIEKNPTLIFLADTKCCGQSAATVATRPGWEGIDAVVNGRVIELDDDIASRWGPRLATLVEQFADAVKSL